MALVKVVRKEPEVKGGAIEALVSEECLAEALNNGWVVAAKTDKKPEPPKTEVKEEVKEVKEEPKKAKKTL